MGDLRLYRLAFAPLVLVLIAISFSLEGVPDPVEPPPDTTEFDSEAAAGIAKDIVALGSSRTPGSEADNAAADLVRKRFEAIVSGSVAEQQIGADVNGNEVTLRNVLLTLPGASQETILVVAGRDAREGEGAAGGAAATGVLIELVDKLSVASRDHTFVFASTSGASAEAQGARALMAGLPDELDVAIALVIAQPGFDRPFAPHLVRSTGDTGSAPIGLVTTAEAVLESRAQITTTTPSVLSQIARYAVPAAAGEQAGLAAEGVGAIAISSAGELPLSATDGERDHLRAGTLERFGPVYLSVLAAVDAAPNPPAKGPTGYLRSGENLVPGWTVELLVLALLLPPVAVSANALARSRRSSTPTARSFGWALEWWIPALAALLSLFALAIIGVIPTTDVPYDPGRYDLGASEVALLTLVFALAAWVWWILGVRRVPDSHGCGAASGLLAAAGCLLVSVGNPYLALVLLPLTHVVAVHGAEERLRAMIAVPAFVVALAPLVLVVGHVASVLGWGASAPWQLAALGLGGGLGVLPVAGFVLCFASALAVTWAAVAPGVLSRPNRPQRGGRAPRHGLGVAPQMAPDGRSYDARGPCHGRCGE